MKLLKKLNQTGFAHQVVILGVVVALAVGAVGYKVLGASHAYVPGGTVSCSLSGPSTVKYGQSLSVALSIGNGTSYTIKPSVNVVFSSYALSILSYRSSTSLGTLSIAPSGIYKKTYNMTAGKVTSYVWQVTGSAPSFACSKTVSVQI